MVNEEVEKLKNQGNDYFKKEEFENAINFYNKALNLNSSDFKDNLYFNLGQCYFNMKNYDKAIENYSNAFKTNPNYYKAIFKACLAAEKTNHIILLWALVNKLLKTEFKNEENFQKFYAKIISNFAYREREFFEKSLKNLMSKTKTNENCFEDDLFNLQISACEKLLSESSNFEAAVELDFFNFLFKILSENQFNFPDEKKIVLNIIMSNIFRLNIEKNQNFDNFCHCLTEGLFCNFEKKFPEYFTSIVSKIVQFCVENNENALQTTIKTVLKSNNELIQRSFCDAIINNCLKSLKAKKLCFEFSFSIIFDNIEILEKNLSQNKIEFLFAAFRHSQQDLNFTNENFKEDFPQDFAEKINENFDQKCFDFVKQNFNNSNMSCNSSLFNKPLCLLLILTKSAPETFIKIMSEQDILQTAINTAYNGIEDCVFNSKCVTILASASSNQVIRASLVKSGVYHLFLDFLAASSRDQIVRATCFLALTKFVMACEDIRSIFIKDSTDFDKTIPVGIQIIEKDLDKYTEENINNVKAFSMFVEGLSYLAVHYQIKKALVLYKNGKMIKNLIKLYNSEKSEGAIKHGLIQIFFHCVMSKNDFSKLFSENSEIEALKNAAQEGLAKAQKDVPREMIQDWAGTEKEIEQLQITLSPLNIISCALDYFKLKISPLKSNSPTTENPPLKNFENFKNYDKFDPSSTPKFKRDYLNSIISWQRTLTALAFNLTLSPHHRPALVQQGAIPLLTGLFEYAADDKIKSASSWALSKILVSTDPRLIAQNSIAAAGRVLIKGAAECAHELHQFEALLALTNFASLCEEARERLIAQGAFEEAKESLFSENDQIQRAAVELFCNLSQCEEGIKRLEKAPEMIKIFGLFCKSEDEKARLAAAAVLAFLSGKNSKIVRENLEENVLEKLGKCGDERVVNFGRIIFENCFKENNEKFEQNNVNNGKNSEKLDQKNVNLEQNDENNVKLVQNDQNLENNEEK